MKGTFEEIKGIQDEYIWLLTGKQICINEATSSANIIKVMRGSRGMDRGSGPPLEKSQSYRVSRILRNITKLPSYQSSMMGHHRQADEVL